MKRAMGFMLAAMSFVLLGGCQSNKALPSLGSAMTKTGLFRKAEERAAIEQSLTDETIAKMLDVKVTARLPGSVALAKLTSECGGFQPRLETVDAEELAGWVEAVKGQASIRDVRPISQLVVGGGKVTIHALRAAAARQDCELLLVYLRADASVDNFNDAAALYWTGVGLLIVPGNVLEHKTVCQAVLLDCRTGMILGTATGSSQAKRVCPAAFVENRMVELARETPPKALADLQASFAATLGRVVTAALARRPS